MIGIEVITVLALSVGGYFFKALKEEIHNLSQSVSDLNTEIAVLQEARKSHDDNVGRIAQLEQRVAVLEALKTHG